MMPAAAFVIGINASSIDPHSNKQHAAGNFQGRLGVSSADSVARQDAQAAELTGLPRESAGADRAARLAR